MSVYFHDRTLDLLDMNRSHIGIIGSAITAFFAICSFRAVAGDKPVMPETFKHQGFGAQQLIPYKDGVLIKSDDFQTYNVSFAKYSAGEAGEVKFKQMEALFDAGRSPGGFLFLGFGNDEMILIEESKTGERKVLPVPDEWQPKAEGDLMPEVRARLVPGNHRCVAIAKDTLWILDDKWKSHKLPPVPKFHGELPSLKFASTPFGAVHALVGDEFYAGWDIGEWGGMLVSIDLGGPKPEWKHLSGKTKGDHTGIVGNNPIEAIVPARDGGLWVADGLSHMGGQWRGLHHRDSSGGWRTLISGEFDEDVGEVKLPVTSSINDLTLDSNGRVYVLAGSGGVFRVEKETLETVFLYDFDIASEKEDHVVGCSLESLAVGNQGEIFISTNSFGILAFKNVAGEWRGKQIMLKSER